MKLTRITIAVKHMEPMVTLYNSLFNAQLEAIQVYGTTLYQGTLADLELLLCPNNIAGVDARQKRKQLRFAVDDVTEIATRIKCSGGDIINREGNLLGVRDPDGNTIEFAEV